MCLKLQLRVVALLIILLSGCATPTPRQTPLRVATNALLIQRGVLTIHGRQFTLNGYLALSESGGMRLVMTQALGPRMVDVLVKNDGSVHVMYVGPSLRPIWIERYVVRDMKHLFGNIATPPSSPCRALDDTHFEVKDRAYTLELRTVETKLGPQPAELFDETKVTK